MSPLLVVTGVGTGIGKTHATCALLLAWARRLTARGRARGVAGLKPIESGGSEDGEALGRMSTFHVKRFPPPYLLARPLSPHLAARAAGLSISLDRVADYVTQVRMAADATVVELPGGLFSPLTDTESNADLVRRLAPNRSLLVAPDRLGVLHDVGAATRAARACGLTIDGIILSAPEQPDASTGSNAAELATVSDVPVVAVLHRETPERLAEELDAFAATLDD